MVGIVPDEIRWRRQKVDFYLSESKWFSKIGNEMKQHIYELEDADNFIDKKTLGKMYIIQIIFIFSSIYPIFNILLFCHHSLSELYRTTGTNLSFIFELYNFERTFAQ